jgi:hypothetical protein
MRIVAFLVGAWLLLAARPASACGVWSMHDTQKKLEAKYLVNSAEILTEGDKQKRVGVFYLDIENKSGIRVVRSRKVVFDVKNGKLLKLGKTVGTIDGEKLTIGKKVFTIALTNPHTMHDMPAWTLAVSLDGETIIEAENAPSLCNNLHGGMTEADQMEEVRRRVIYYIAWREIR